MWETVPQTYYEISLGIVYKKSIIDVSFGIAGRRVLSKHHFMCICVSPLQELRSGDGEVSRGHRLGGVTIQYVCFSHNSLIIPIGSISDINFQVVKITEWGGVGGRISPSVLHPLNTELSMGRILTAVQERLLRLSS